MLCMISLHFSYKCALVGVCMHIEGFKRKTGSRLMVRIFNLYFNIKKLVTEGLKYILSCFNQNIWFLYIAISMYVFLIVMSLSSCNINNYYSVPSFRWYNVTLVTKMTLSSTLFLNILSFPKSATQKQAVEVMIVFPSTTNYNFVIVLCNYNLL